MQAVEKKVIIKPSSLLIIVMDPIFTLLFILTAAWCMGLLFKRFNLPMILGELSAGLIIGPPILGLVGPSGSFFPWTPIFDTLAKFGMFSLIFYAGLKTDPKAIMKNIKPSFAIGILGTLTPIVLGTLVTWLFTHNFWTSIIIGIAISSTSLVTKTRILSDLNLLKSKIGHTIVGGALVDNIFSFIIVGIVIELITTGATNILGMGYVILSVLITFAAVIFIGYYVYPKIGGFFSQEGTAGSTFTLLVGLLIAAVGHEFGLHFIIGAYLAGLFVSNEFVGRKFNDIKLFFHTLSHDFIGPLFLVSVAFHVKLGVLITHAPFLILLLGAAMIGKFIGAGFGAHLAKLKKKEAFVIGMAMNGRGTTELILAMIGLELGILTDVHVSLLVFVAFVTTLLVPVGLKYAVSKHPSFLEA